MLKKSSDETFPSRVLVTGGCGFIGWALVRYLVEGTDAQILNLDKLSYASNPLALTTPLDLSHYRFARVDICDRSALAEALTAFRPDAIVHLAAESHVDRSIDGPSEFVAANIVGTFSLLEETLRYWEKLSASQRATFRFLHVSTDEVFGSLSADDPPFTGGAPYRPNSPYSASKAASDHLVRAWNATYDLPVIVSNATNTYGPYQFPEKLIPTAILSALTGRPVPVYGGGENVRDWIFIDDHVRALTALLARGRPGETYLVGAEAERRNLDLVRDICRLVDELRPGRPARREELIQFVADRPGHDLRYASDCTKLREELDWQPRVSLDEGLQRTVRWYIDNERWWRSLEAASWQRSRLGVRAAALP